jgi:hypothetical protein
MVRTVLCSLAVSVLGLAGCTASEPADQPRGASATVAVADRTQALWAGRTAYVGDSSKVVALVDAAGFGPRGSYSVALWTTRPPYAVTVTLSDPAKPFDTTDLAGPATLLLGTVTNLDTVHVTSAGQTYTLTARQATATLGRDVKTLGTDRAALEDYVGSLDD